VEHVHSVKFSISLESAAEMRGGTSN